MGGTRDPRLGEGSKWWTVERACVFFFAVNLLNYIDRGIAPGAASEFNGFITKSLGTESPDLFLGLLQSAFIVGFSLAAIVFGHVIHYCHPFRMVGCGLAIWVVATCMSGLAQTVGSYEFLFVARMLSGVGEASFQCVVPPFITDLGGNAGGRWLALFYTAIPLGTAIGYPWGSLFATSSWGWAWAFYVESILMFPVAVLCFFLPFTWRPERAPIEEEDEEETGTEGESERSGEEEDGDGEESERRRSLERHAAADARARAASAHVTLKEEFLVLVQRPVYILNVMGYAATTAMMIGVSTFGSALLLEFGYYKHESSASTVFGIVLSLAGMLGTPLGGALIDRQRQHAHSEEAKLVYILRQNTLLSLAGMLLACLSCFVYTRGLFLLCFALGAFLLFVCTAGINLCTMLAVPPANRSFAIAVNTLCIHAFGDVPSPIVVGALLDRMAPACARDSKQNGGDVGAVDFVVSPECQGQIIYVRWTLFLTCAWLSLSVLFFAAAWALARKQYLQHHAGHAHVLAVDGGQEGVLDDDKRRPLLQGQEGEEEERDGSNGGRRIVL